jgi:hypothetical protein
MEELWKPIEGFSNYEVSTLGRVRKGSLILKQRTMSGIGYRTVNLITTAGVFTSRMVARLVLTTFVGSGKHVYYKDGDYANCQLSNLEWVPMTKLRHTPKRWKSTCVIIVVNL